MRIRYYNWKLRLRVLGLTVNDLIGSNNDNYQNKELFLSLNNGNETEYEKYVMECITNKLKQRNGMSLCARRIDENMYGIINKITEGKIEFVVCSADDSGEMKKYNAKEIESIDYIYLIIINVCHMELHLYIHIMLI